MSQSGVENARRAALVIVLLGVCCYLPPLRAQQSAQACYPRLVAAYTSGSLPADLRQLCDTDHRPQRAWLASIELGAEVDIVRYWDLLQLAADLDRAAPTPPLADTLLAGILAETSVQTVAPPSWLDRLQAWLKARLGEGDDADLAWLEDWLKKLADHRVLLDVMLRVTVVLTLVAALYVVLREIEIGGGWQWPWRALGRTRPITKLDMPAVAAPLRWSEVLAMPAAARPAALLRWLLLELRARQLLPGDTSLTNRELLQLLQTPHPALAAPFAALLDELEPCLYGDHTVPSLAALTSRVAALCDAADGP